MKEEAGQTYREHDCKDWRHLVMHNQSDCWYYTCGTCGSITDFHWKSFWRRLKGLFKR